VAGNETTTYLAGNAVAAFAAHPGQGDLLFRQRDLLPFANRRSAPVGLPGMRLFRATTGPLPSPA